MRSSSIARLKKQNYCSRIFIPLIFTFLCFAFAGCDMPGINSNGVGNSNAGNCNGIDVCNTNNNSNPVNSSQQNGGTTNCLGSNQTGGGTTAAYSISVDQGCDVIVQGVVGENVGPYNWNNGAVAALGPGSYSFTITDGSYQMLSDANAQAAFCNAINWIQTNGKALGQTFPLSGWGSC